MAKIAIRRVVKSCAPASVASAAGVPRRLSASGITMSFDTIMASATVSTMTIAVAADKPPMKATSVINSEWAASGSATTNISLSTRPAGKVSSPAIAIGSTNRLISTR